MAKNKRILAIILAVASILLLSATVIAKSTTETLNVIYDNIKIMIDGVEYIPTDVNGNVIEPFIYNGTTYLPVRGIANAFDKDVDWEAQTSTVIIGSKNYDWLDQMGYVGYDTSGKGNDMVTWVEGDKGTDGIKYDRGLSFHLDYRYGQSALKENNDGSVVSYQSVEYLLNGSYETFECTLLCADKGNNNQTAIVKIYGDGNLLYNSPPMTEGTKPLNIALDVSNYKILKIYMDIPNLIPQGKYSESSNRTDIGLIDARLAKK